MGEFDFIFDSEEVNTSQKVRGMSLVVRDKKDETILARQADCDGIMPDIEQGYTYHIISSDSFGSIEILRNIITKNDCKEIYVTTWSINDNFIEIVKKLLNEGILIYFAVDKSLRTRKSHLYAQMVELADNHKNLIVVIHHMLHSKVTLIDCGAKKISIEGSANYSNNQRVENFTISTSPDVFNFHKEWMNKIKQWR